MLNLLTIDVEDYFQVHAFSRVIKYEDWDRFECRVERNTDRLLSILDSVLSPQHSPKGTFFILGWLAERYPDLVRRIQKEGHEIACHGYAHRLVYTQSRDEFRQDVRRTKSILEDVTGQEIIGYRAPSYSITKKSEWAFEVLAEEGFKYDSSIFPIRHDFYGIPEAPRFPFIVSFNRNNNCEFSVLNFELNSFRPSPLPTRHPALSPQSSVLEASNISSPHHRTTAAPFQGIPHSPLDTRHSLIEFPLSTVKLFGANFPISGGGYFRLFPYPLIRMGLKSINEKEGKPFIFYVHPWEFDPNQPRINGISARSRFRHYVNLDKTEEKFRRLLSEFTFTSIREILAVSNLFEH
jgi:polysaccharide deacetylase family protein (PEP-CTERM system associated)